MVLAGMDSKNFMQNPQFLWQHGYSGAEVNTIGKILQLQVVGDTLLALAEFADADICPLAEQIFNLSSGGYLPANSIGFCPIEYSMNDDGGCTYTKWELVECSKCEIPMNPEAIDKALHPKKELAITLDESQLVTKEGRTHSGATIKELNDHIEAIRGYAKGLNERADALENSIAASLPEKGDPPPFDKAVRPKKNFKIKLQQADLLHSSLH